MFHLSKDRLHGQHGFTLMETILAIAIISVLGIAVIRALDTNARSARTLDEQVQATNLVTAYLENIRQLPYSDNSSPYNTAGANVVMPPQYSVVMDFFYSGDGVNFQSTNNSGAYTLQKISISVYRTNGHLVMHTCTYRAKR